MNIQYFSLSLLYITGQVPSRSPDLMPTDHTFEGVQSILQQILENNDKTFSVCSWGLQQKMSFIFDAVYFEEFRRSSTKYTSERPGVMQPAHQAKKTAERTKDGVPGRIPVLSLTSQPAECPRDGRRPRTNEQLRTD